MMDRSLISKLTLLAIAWTMIVTPALAQNEREKIAAKYRNGVVMLTAYRGPLDTPSGTGFLISDRIVITNDHVVRGAQSVTADFFGKSESVPCELIDSDSDLDLAALRLQRPTKRIYPAFRISDDIVGEAVQGADIFLIGHPVKLPLSVLPGSIAAHLTLEDLFRSDILKIMPRDGTMKMIELSVNATHGMSGAPVMNYMEKVIGVQRLGYKDGEFGLNYCIPANYIRQLKLSKTPQKFAGGNGPILQSNLQSFNLVQQDNAANPAPQPDPNSFGAGMPAPPPGAAIPPPDAGTFNINTRAWGFVPNDSNVIFNSYLEDQQGFSNTITKSLVDQLLARGGGNPCVVHLTNPFFRYSIMAPNWFHIEEFPTQDRLGLKTVLTYDDPQVPDGLNRLLIFAKKIQPPGPSNEEVMAAFNFHTNQIMQDALGLQVVDPNNPPPDLNDRHVVLNVGRSDETPRAIPNRARVRFRGNYVSAPQFNKSYFVLFGLADDSFVTMTFQYQTTEIDKQTNFDKDYIERLFIAASLSFFD